jgi:hypothetical protein
MRWAGHEACIGRCIQAFSRINVELPIQVAKRLHGLSEHYVYLLRKGSTQLALC